MALHPGLLAGTNEDFVYVAYSYEAASGRRFEIRRYTYAQDLPTATEVGSGDFSSYQGKILRMNLDGTVPADNTKLSGVRSPVFSFGHRNPQGIAFDSSGVLHSSERHRRSSSIRPRRKG